MKILLSVLRYLAVKNHRFRRLYLRVARLDSKQYARFLKDTHFFYSMGENCYVNNDVVITDPKLVKIGNDVTLSSCTLLCHDGVVGTLNVIYKERLDSVGRIEIGDRVFVGYGAIIMPNTVVGSNSVIAAGAVVTKDVCSGDIVAGVPAKPIGKLDDLAKSLKERTAQYPWADLIESRDGPFDADIEPTLLKMRQEHFFR